MPRVQFVLLVFAALLTTAIAVDTSYRIWCYTGLKYIIGQEEKQDAEECFAFFGMKNYCYKFVASTPVQDIVKLGCSSFICSGLRNTCTKMEFSGVNGTMCCCNDTSYCNSARSPSILISFIIFPLLFHFLN